MASPGMVGHMRCQCGTINTITSSHCELCDNMLLSPKNAAGECFRVGQAVTFERLATKMPDRGTVVRFIHSRKTGELLVQIKYSERQFNADIYDELHSINRVFTVFEYNNDRRGPTSVSKKELATSMSLSSPSTSRSGSPRRESSVSVPSVSLSPSTPPSTRTRSAAESTIDLTLPAPRRSAVHLMKSGRSSDRASDSRAEDEGRSNGKRARERDVVDSPPSHKAKAEDEDEVTIFNKSKSRDQTEEAPAARKSKIQSKSDGDQKDRERSHSKKNKKQSKEESQRRDDTDNRDICTVCGHGGEIVCCDNCPRGFHSRCLLTNCPKAKPPNPDDENEWWSCPFCVTGVISFTLSDFDVESKDPYKYMNLFLTSRRSRHDSAANVTLGTFLHYVEITVVDPGVILQVAGAVSSIMMTATSNGVDDLTMLVVPISGAAPNATAGEEVSAQHVTDVLQQALGAETFDRLMAEALAGGHFLATGLKPALTDSKLYCRCGKNRLFRTFCYSCGVLFRINNGLYLSPINYVDEKILQPGQAIVSQDCEEAAVRGKHGLSYFVLGRLITLILHSSCSNQFYWRRTPYFR
jgi:hypothetical protein